MARTYVLWTLTLLAPVLHRVLFLFVLCTAPAVAQSTAEAVLDAWLTDWDEAAVGLESVDFDETLYRSINGPRGTLELKTRGSIRLLTSARPRRSVAAAWVNDEPTDLEKRTEMERRLRHALGQAGSDLTRPAPLPIRLLESAEPIGEIRSVRLHSRPAIQITLLRPSRRGPAERLTAWFSSIRSPRLLRIDRERHLQHGETLSRVTTYTRVDGLDIPLTHTVDAEIEQRRRLRTYTLVIHAEATYGAPQVNRDER